MSSARFIPIIRSRVATSIPPSSLAIRSISSTAKYQKGPVETTKDTIKKADRVVSDAAVKGIDKGEQTRDKIKGAMGTATQETKTKAGEVKGQAAENVGYGKGKAEQAAGEAKGKAEEVMGEAKGKAKEAKQTHIG
ncbi:uncharacterized protein N7459_004250 [Penicillium hispanicum]|uniref:uncharacterized protein n=1 Tax=Penicillium hispanicum TaxID=1080232 RepID=UPI002542372E|nr:uncharacterized protein N7459_004250 [Penicillium hispanicum]KAJ5584450.1 hypothetical protein N7459_004250 [Penicillium hispanicum]